MCKRPLDISARQGKEDLLEDANANCTDLVEQRDGSNTHSDLFRLRNGTVVRRVVVDAPGEHTYNVVWPLEYAEKQLRLRHYGDPSPLTHSGGWLGPCYDIVGHVIKIEDNKVFIPPPVRLKSPFAYVVTLWGADPGFVLGALVLAGALQRSGSKQDRLLLHTSDLPKSSRTILAEAWDLVRVEYVDADAGLFHEKGTRFDCVFTKLHALSLVDYEKVLVLDIDLAVIDCPDELFDLPAPAAMHRSMSPVPHGSRINSRSFFCRRIRRSRKPCLPMGAAWWHKRRRHVIETG
jgi:hypothetical protein